MGECARSGGGSREDEEGEGRNGERMVRMEREGKEEKKGEGIVE